MQVLHKPTAIERQRMAGHVAIVTGAAHGLGAAIARRLIAEGADVLAVDVNVEGLAALADEPHAAVLIGDITLPETAVKAVGLAVEKFGKVDVLVNNAGIMDAFKPVTEVSDELWAKVLAVNVTAPMMLTRAVLPRMLEAKSGAIVNVSSVGGIVGGRAGAAYTASKHALIGLTRNTAANYIKDGVRCNAVCPGAVDTGIPLGGEPSPRGYATLQMTLPANPGQAQPDELAEVVAFLASDEASFVNGAVVVADEGWTAA